MSDPLRPLPIRIAASPVDLAPVILGIHLRRRSKLAKFYRRVYLESRGTFQRTGRQPTAKKIRDCDLHSGAE